MQSVHRTDACEGHVNDIAGLETIFAKSLGVALREHVHNVGRCWFCSIQCRFRTEVHATNGSRIEAVPVDELHDGHGAHGGGVFVNVWDGHGFKAEPLVQFSIIGSPKVCKVLHVHVKAGEMNGDVVNANGCNGCI